jgi:hypothetical protein
MRDPIDPAPMWFCGMHAIDCFDASEQFVVLIISLSGESAGSTVGTTSKLEVFLQRFLRVTLILSFVALVIASVTKHWANQPMTTNTPDPRLRIGRWEQQSCCTVASLP